MRTVSGTAGTVAQHTDAGKTRQIDACNDAGDGEVTIIARTDQNAVDRPHPTGKRQRRTDDDHADRNQHPHRLTRKTAEARSFPEQSGLRRSRFRNKPCPAGRLGHTQGLLRRSCRSPPPQGSARQCLWHPACSIRNSTSNSRPDRRQAPVHLCVPPASPWPSDTHVDEACGRTTSGRRPYSPSCRTRSVRQAS